MGPTIRVPEDVARRLEDETDLVEVDRVLPDVVEAIDVQLGPVPGDILLLTETPKEGFDLLVQFILEYARSAPRPLELIVSDKECGPHAFPEHTDVNESSIRDLLKLAYFGEPGDRRPLLRGTIPPPT